MSDEQPTTERPNRLLGFNRIPSTQEEWDEFKEALDQFSSGTSQALRDTIINIQVIDSLLMNAGVYTKAQFDEMFAEVCKRNGIEVIEPKEESEEAPDTE